MNDKETPKIILGDYVFKVDKHNRMLTDIWDKDNRIEIDEYGTFIYDNVKRNAAVGDYEMPYAYDRLTSVFIPESVLQMDRIPTEIEASLLNEKAIKHKGGYQVVSESVNNRLSGLLPQIEIAGLRYTVDIDSQKLTQDFPGYGPLDFNDFEMTSEETFLFFYHKPSRASISLSRESLERLNDSLLIEIPSVPVLDPIGRARQIGAGDCAYLPTFPVVPLHQPLKSLALSKINDPLSLAPATDNRNIESNIGHSHESGIKR